MTALTLARHVRTFTVLATLARTPSTAAIYSARIELAIRSLLRAARLAHMVRRAS